MTRLGCLVEASQELEALSRPGSAVQKQTGEVNWGRGHRDHPPEHWQGGGWGWGWEDVICSRDSRKVR